MQNTWSCAGTCTFDTVNFSGSGGGRCIVDLSSVRNSDLEDWQEAKEIITTCSQHELTIQDPTSLGGCVPGTGALFIFTRGVLQLSLGGPVPQNDEPLCLD